MRNCLGNTASRQTSAASRRLRYTAVALKVLSEQFVLDADRVARFKREAQLLGALSHPNIAIIHGFEETNGICALVLELVEEPTLADRIARTGTIRAPSRLRSRSIPHTSRM